MFRPFRNLARTFSIEVGQVLRDGSELIHPIVWRPATEIALPSTSFHQSLSPDDRKHLEFIRKEVELFSRLTPYFPTRIDDTGWHFLINCESRRQRLDHVIFMAKNERLGEKDKKRKLEKAAERSEKKYHGWKTMVNWNLGRIDKEEKRWASIKVVQAYRLQDRPSLAVDCRFLENMSPRAAQLTGSQMKHLVSSNRFSSSPWPLYFANYNPAAPGTSSAAQRHLSPMLKGKTGCSPICTDQNYTSLFPKDKIIYLSPHADEELLDMQEDDVLYVIGGIVDRVREKNIHPWASRVTAEADGVRCAKFPLDQFIKWKSGSKYLTLTAVANIIHDVHATGGDWETALARHIPVRNTRPPEEKNRLQIDKQKRIREFNHQLLRIVEEHLPQLEGKIEEQMKRL